jgi:hypothetical protein
MPEQDQEFVEFIVKALVDHPEEVKTDRSVDEMGVLITLSLNAEDMGQVIGRQGQTAKAIRTLLRVVGAKHKARVNLKINEPEGSHRPERRSEPSADRPAGAFADSHDSQEPQDSRPAPLDSLDPLDDFKL